MSSSAKLILTALSVALVLADAVGSATARSLSTSDQNFRVAWSSLEFTNEIATVRCRVTLEGSFVARTIGKVQGLLTGRIPGATVGHPCTNGEAWFDNGREAEPLGTAPQKLPIHLTFESFDGTLPAITAVEILWRLFEWVTQSTALGIPTRCRYGRVEDTVLLTASRTVANGAITSLTPVAGRNRVSLVDGLLNGGLCSSTAGVAGASGPMTSLSSGSTITITLI